MGSDCFVASRLKIRSSLLSAFFYSVMHRWLGTRTAIALRTIWKAVSKTYFPHSPGTSKKLQRFSDLFISVRRSTCFRWFFRPPSGAQNCSYSVRHLSDRYCYLLLAAGSSNGLTLYVQFCAPDDGRKKHSETCRASYRNK